MKSPPISQVIVQAAQEDQKRAEKRGEPSLNLGQELGQEPGQEPGSEGGDRHGDQVAQGGLGGLGTPAERVGEDGRVQRALRLRQERKLQILKVALCLFADKGYHQTSILDILQGADIARGTFYQYFDSKRAIFDELLDELLSRLRGVVRRVELSPTADPPLVQIEQNLARVLSVLITHREHTRITLRLAEGMDEDCDRKMAEFYGQLRTLLTSALENGQKMGLLRPFDSKVVALCALGSFKEVAREWVASRDSVTKEELEAVIRELLSFSLRGLYNLSE